MAPEVGKIRVEQSVKALIYACDETHVWWSDTRLTLKQILVFMCRIREHHEFWEVDESGEHEDEV